MAEQKYSINEIIRACIDCGEHIEFSMAVISRLKEIKEAEKNAIIADMDFDSKIHRHNMLNYLLREKFGLTVIDVIKSGLKINGVDWMDCLYVSESEMRIFKAYCSDYIKKKTNNKASQKYIESIIAGLLREYPIKIKD
jgi:hypothetical protein